MSRPLLSSRASQVARLLSCDCTNLIGLYYVSDVFQIAICEHKAHVALDVRQQFLQLGALFHASAYDLPDCGVLPHEHHALVAKRRADLLHLIRPHVIRSHNEHSRVLCEQLLTDKPLSR